MNRKKSTDWVTNTLAVILFVIFIAAIIGLRLWIAGPECFVATDVGVCQAIRSVGK